MKNALVLTQVLLRIIFHRPADENKTVCIDRIAQLVQRLGYVLYGRGSIPNGGYDGIFFFATNPDRLWLTQPPIQWVPDDHSLEVKRPGLETDHSPPSSAKVKNAWRYNSSPPLRFHDIVRT
jgi:hypothetical protein